MDTKWTKIAKILKAIGWTFVLGTTVLGAWLASSIAAYLNGPPWLALGTALLLFPGLPLGWEVRGQWRARKANKLRRATGEEARAPWLRWSTRLILRTVLINLLFVGTLLTLFPQAGFAALATRGDWFLEPIADAKVAHILRPALFGGAEMIEWVYLMSADNPYAAAVPERQAVPRTSEIGEVERRKPGEPEGTGHAWPLPAEPHPVAMSVPIEVETDYASVARYIGARESDPFQRVKALHDYIGLRLSYDWPAFHAKQYPSQEASDTFARRLAVCSGYARLLKAMAQVTGDEVTVITGQARSQDSNYEITGGNHAWNGVRLNGKWYLVDVTWDDGDDRFGYRTNYLFGPPEFFGATHFPRESEWQLREDELSRAEFFRLPMLQAEYFAAGVTLTSPRRPQIDTSSGEVIIELDNPRRVPIAALVTPPIAAARKPGDLSQCAVEGDDRVRIVCKTPPGKHHIIVQNKQMTTECAVMIHFTVNSR